MAERSPGRILTIKGYGPITQAAAIDIAEAVDQHDNPSCSRRDRDAIRRALVAYLGVQQGRALNTARTAAAVLDKIGVRTRQRTSKPPRWHGPMPAIPGGKSSIPHGRQHR